MARRARHPMLSVLMFLVLGVASYLLWTNRDQIRMERKVHKVDAVQIASIEEAIIEAFEDDECWDGMRAGLLYRGGENRFRVEIDIHASCSGNGRKLCEAVAEFIHEKSGGKSASVWGFTGGSIVAKSVL